MTYSLDPAVAAAGSLRVLAELAGVSESTLRRWMPDLDDYQADRLAIAVGMHPAELWPSWFDDGLHAPAAPARKAPTGLGCLQRLPAGTWRVRVSYGGRRASGTAPTRAGAEVLGARLLEQLVDDVAA